MRVLLLGATGMLGSAIYSVLRGKYPLTLAIRDRNLLSNLEERYGAIDDQVVAFDARYRAPLHLFDKPDFVVNAIGVTIPFAQQDPDQTYYINGIFPHILAHRFGSRLIHITTDCVYNGTKGYPYDEDSKRSPTDLYGLSKSIGEPPEAMVIRTSIIGRELKGFTGLLEWFLKQKGKTVDGFKEHFWNGVTTLQLAKIIDRILTYPDLLLRPGLFHVFSDTVTKYDMLLAFEKKYQIGCVINASYTSRLNRTLTTIRSLNALLKVPSFEKMLEDL